MIFGAAGGAFGFLSGAGLESAAGFPIAPSKALTANGLPQGCWARGARATAAPATTLRIHWRRDSDFLFEGQFDESTVHLCDVAVRGLLPGNQHIQDIVPRHGF